MPQAGVINHQYQLAETNQIFVSIFRNFPQINFHKKNFLKVLEDFVSFNVHHSLFNTEQGMHCESKLLREKGLSPVIGSW